MIDQVLFLIDLKRTGFCAAIASETAQGYLGSTGFDIIFI